MDARNSQRINVILSSDDRVACYLPVVMVSMFENHKNYDVHFYLLHHRISHENLQLMDQTARYYGQYFHEIRMDPGLFSHSSFLDRWPIECFYYFLAHQYLPDSEDRALYLDSDQLVMGDISAYYFADFEGNMILVAGGLGNKDKVKDVVDEKTRLTASTQAGAIFCSGSLMLNLAMFREENITSDTLIAEQEKRTSAISPDDMHGDQGLLNYMFYNRAGFYPPIYQATIWGQTAQSVSNIRIFHFMGHPKPWVEYYDDSYRRSGMNLFEDPPYWVYLCGKWWDYAALAPNATNLISAGKQVFYRKLEHLFRKYASKKSVVTRLKARKNMESSILPYSAPGYVPEADAVVFSQDKVDGCRVFTKRFDYNYRVVIFPCDCYLQKGTNYIAAITVKATAPYKLSLYVGNSNHRQLIQILELTDEFQVFTFSFSPNNDKCDYICFGSTGMPLGMSVIVEQLSIEGDRSSG